MECTSERTLADLVLDEPATAHVLERYGLDYCCKGGRSLATACAEKGLDVAQVVHVLEAELHTAIKERSFISPDRVSLAELIGHIERVHHGYVRTAIPALVKHTERIALVHGANHPELIEVRDLFAFSAGQLTKHMAKEELILFPEIRRMEEAHRSGTPRPPSSFGSIANPIAGMEEDHREEGGRLARIREITGDHTPPADACTTYRLTLQELRRFEEDLHMHVHLENHVLFPKAVLLETIGGGTMMA